MSSLFKTQKVETPKAGAGLFDVVNEAMGVSQTLTKDASGNVTSMLISELPKTAAEKELMASLESTIQGGMDSLAKLQGTSAADFLDEPAVQDFMKYNDALLSKAQGKASQQHEEILAQRGLSESTSGTESRAALQGQMVAQRDQAGLQALDYANNLRSQQLGEAANSINIANALTTGQQAVTQQGISGSQNASSLGLQSASLQNQVNMANTSYSAANQKMWQGLVGTAVGGAFGGLQGAAIGNAAAGGKANINIGNGKS